MILHPYPLPPLAIPCPILLLIVIPILSRENPPFPAIDYNTPPFSLRK